MCLTPVARLPHSNRVARQLAVSLGRELGVPAVLGALAVSMWLVPTMLWVRERRRRTAG